MGASVRSWRHRLVVVVTLACASAPAAASATPVAGQAVDVAPVEDFKAASVKCPGDAAFVKLTGPRQIPLGCDVDATNGGLAITTARADGTTQTGRFSGGNVHFKITQDGDAGVVTLGPTDCRRASPTLYVNVQGLFRTVARYGSATGVNETWRVIPNCNATTEFWADSGTLEVRDFATRKTAQVRPEKVYIAGARHGCGNLLAEPSRSPYAAVDIAVSGLTCSRARGVLLDWVRRLPPYKGKKTKPFPTTSGGWTFDAGINVGRSYATRGVASITFKVITTFFANA